MPRNKPSDDDHQNGKPCSLPAWRGRVLWFRGHALKRFGRLAPDVELILEAFQEQNWIAFIDDPLAPKPGRGRKRRLHMAIQNFNRRIDFPLLRLRGDGTGTRVGWLPVLSTPLSTPTDTSRLLDKRRPARKMRRSH
jgi:hypothetical protein